MVSVIIPSYNSEKTIAGCLEALQNQSYSGEYEIILVDSSDDRTPQIVRSQFPEIKYIHLQQKTDPGTARNLGVEESTGELLLFIDSDCRAAPDWIECHIQRHRDHNVAACGGAVINGNDHRSNVAWAGYLAEFREFIPEQPGREVEHIPTCNISYKRNIFESLQGFNPRYYPQEDLEFNFRLRKNGAIIYFDPDVKIEHRHRTELKSFFIHQNRVGKITSKMLKILPLEGAEIARNKTLALLMLPALPVVKWLRTVLLFWRLQRKTIVKHPMSTVIFAIGLIPWAAGFISGVFTNINDGKK